MGAETGDRTEADPVLDVDAGSDVCLNHYVFRLDDVRRRLVAEVGPTGANAHVQGGEKRAPVPPLDHALDSDGADEPVARGLDREVASVAPVLGGAGEEDRGEAEAQPRDLVDSRGAGAVLVEESLADAATGVARTAEHEVVQSGTCVGDLEVRPLRLAGLIDKPAHLGLRILGELAPVEGADCTDEAVDQADDVRGAGGDLGIPESRQLLLELHLQLGVAFLGDLALLGRDGCGVDSEGTASQRLPDQLVGALVHLRVELLVGSDVHVDAAGKL